MALCPITDDTGIRQYTPRLKGKLIMTVCSYSERPVLGEALEKESAYRKPVILQMNTLISRETLFL